MGYSQPEHQNKDKITNLPNHERIQRDKANKKRSLQRTDQRLRRLINANIGKHGSHTDKFITLTFKNNITDHDTANKEFRNFIRRLNYHVFKKQSGLAYIAVIERQDRGALHYHTIFFNLPYIPQKKLLEIWRNKKDKRGLHVKRIDNINNVGAYVVKYIQKDLRALMFENNDSLSTAYAKGKKLYFSSRNLYTPLEKSMTKKELEVAIDDLMANATYEVFSASYENEYRGVVKYWQFKLKN